MSTRATLQPVPSARRHSWVCPRLGVPVHFELVRRRAKSATRPALPCPVCRDDHSGNAAALLGADVVATWEIALHVGPVHSG